ncbi:MAG: 16S rRNA (cytidine(1402)-2'-O)-methyltransferase [Candidatus Schekmanbacteria bacterium]|nr:16S rRNA (cytidine(1402)-2'-O)-methyltransferase [Candidatus Schekmanbacteria bacterium]
MSQPNQNEGILYVVATPIGNLEDITLRALRILKEVDLIAAEDTRRTRKLLTAYDLHTPLISYYAHNERHRGAYLIEQLQEGKNIALVSDAGTPGIADPGYYLLKLAWEAGIKVVPIPGASVITALLSVSGLPSERFRFENFLPPKTGQRRKRLEQLKSEDYTLVVFESPYRIIACLEDMAEILGEREIVIGREVTKQFEEFLRGTPSELLSMMKGKNPKGEFALIIRAEDD